MSRFLRAVTVVAVMGGSWLVGPVSATSTFYFSTVSLESGIVPTPGNPQVTLEIGEAVTLYLWAQFGSGTSTVMGIDFVESNTAVVVGSSVQLWNDALNALSGSYDPDDRTTGIYRWLDWYQRPRPDGSVGFVSSGGFLDFARGAARGPAIDVTVGLTDSYHTLGDPTLRGASSPYQWYVGSVTFTGAEVGQTDIVLTINDVLMLGNSGMIGTPASPGLYLGAGESSPVPVSVAYGTIYYIDAGVTGAVADATITVVPEPGVGAVVVIGVAGVMRRMR